MGNISCKDDLIVYALCILILSGEGEGKDIIHDGSIALQISASQHFLAEPFHRCGKTFV